MFDFSSLLNGNRVTLLIAFLAGISTFFASCILPLVPMYLAYLSGVSLASATEAEIKQQRWHIVRMALLFVTGFIGVFVVLGLLLHQASAALATYRWWIQKIGGLFFILFGLVLLKVIKPSWITKERKLGLANWLSDKQWLHALTTGAVFGFSWTPCIGPVLAVILYWSAQQATAWKGVFLLITYGLGIGTPFIFVALAFEKIMPILTKYKKVSYYMTLISGITILLAGLFLLSGNFQKLSFSLLNWTRGR